MRIFLIIMIIIWAICFLTIAICTANAMDFNPAWEEDMLTQEELEELANALWEEK